MPFLPGFDETWRDAPDFMHGVNDALWAQGAGAVGERFLAPDVAQYDAAGELRGAQVVGSLIDADRASFSPMERRSEDVIWCPVGYKSMFAAHRAYCQARHAGPGLWGAPTGRTVSWRVMSDCFCRGDRIAEMWTVRDSGAILSALGKAPDSFARDIIARMGGPDACVPPLRPAPPVLYDGQGNNSDWALTLADLLTRVSGGDIAQIERHYDPGAELFYAGGQRGHGVRDAELFWRGLRASLPDARMQVVHLTGLDEALSPPRAALRWWLSGRHEGWGRFGAPSGAELHIMGMTHAEFGPEGLRREWSLIDDLSVWQQILIARGAVDEPPAAGPMEVAD